jgi:hypothetical protein
MKYISNYKLFKEYVNIKKEDIDEKYILNINSKEKLENILKEYKIDLSIWGTKKRIPASPGFDEKITVYKTINHLWNEIKEEECVIYGYEGKLIREVNFVGARILYFKEGEKYRLTEKKAIFKNGKVRERKIWYSMAEKFKYGEDPELALIRGMEEELKIQVSKEQCTFYNKLHFPNNEDYPGIESFHTGYSYLILLNDEQYNPDGYVENQPDKDIYFEWVKF